MLFFRDLRHKPMQLVFPTSKAGWYFRGMGDTYSARMGNKGRIVVPAGLRERHGWTDDTVLVFVDDEDGVRFGSREELLASIRKQLAETDPVGELIAERRAAAEKENAE